MKIFCSGIGGIGLSAYAALQKQAGHDVYGSDRADSPLLDDLRSQGIHITLEQDGAFVPDDCELFVYSEAIPETAPERQRATELGVEQQSYFHALGEMSKGHQVIAVCGTHGKSSTTAMLAHILIAAGKDPTVVVGTKVPQLEGRNWRRGESNLFVVEACEYRCSFHNLHPDMILMTNVTGDHFDAFETVQGYEQAFIDFLQRLPADGLVVTHGNDADCQRVIATAQQKSVDADSLELPTVDTPGTHMQQNAQVALRAAMELGVDEAEARQHLQTFTGTWRRGELKGEYQGIPVIDDYGHHPNEIRATLQAFRETYPDKRLVCVFQPHTHNRILALYDQFTAAFSAAALLIVAPVYDARSDIETGTVNLADLAAAIAQRSTVETMTGESLEQIETQLKTEILRDGDVLVCMGAGDITALATNLVT